MFIRRTESDDVSTASGSSLTDTTDAKFLFAGLELHTESSLPFHGHTLRYTSVEAGHHAGRSAQLSLDASPSTTQTTTTTTTTSTTTGDDISPDPEDATNNLLTRSYLKEVLQVANGRYFPWIGSRPVEHVASADELAA
jgi:hypothetical protein